MRATSTLTRMGAAAQEQLRGASAVDSRTDEPRRRALHGQHSRANARETEQMSGDSPSGGAHFSMCTFDRAGCKDGSVLAAGGAAIRGSSGRSSEYYDRVPDRNSFATNSSGRTFVMYHGTTWRNWQRIKQHGFLLSNSASGLGEGVYLTRSERKAEFYRKSKWGVIVKVRVELGKSHRYEVRCGVYVFGAAAPLGELGLPLTPSAGWTLPEGAQVQCPRGVLAIRGKRHSKRDREPLCVPNRQLCYSGYWYCKAR